MVSLLNNRYQFQKTIGQGGMGKVYLVEDTFSGELVVVKECIPKENAQNVIERIKREYQFMKKIQHPNLVSALDFFQQQGRYFIVMEFVEGMTLQVLIHSHPRSITLEEQLHIAQKICDVVAALNENDIIHRDLKPDNIIVQKNSLEPKLLDLGIAKAINSELANITKTNTIIGTPQYMSPEQIDDKMPIGKNTDVFALGAMLYQFFSWQKHSPFYGGNIISTMDRVLRLEVPPLTACMNTNNHSVVFLSKVLSQALQKDPQQRIASAHDMFLMLQNRDITSDGTTPKVGTNNTPKRNVNKGHSTSRLRKQKALTSKNKRPTILTYLAVALSSLLLGIFSSNFFRQSSLENNIRVISPAFLQNNLSKTVSLSTGVISLAISLPPGIVEIHTHEKRIPWNQRKTQFTQEVLLHYGKNTIDITFLHNSGQYYKLQRKLTRTQEKNTILFRENVQRLAKTQPDTITPLKLQWKFSTQDSPVTFSPLAFKHHIFFGDRSGIFYCVDKHGKLLWKFKSSDGICGYGSIFDNIIYFGNKSGSLYGLDIYTGKQLFHCFLGQPQRFSPLLKDGIIYVNTDMENVYAIDLKTAKTIWRYQSENQDEFYSSPSFYKDYIILTEYTGKVLCLDCKTGNVLWETRIQRRCYSSPIVIKDTIYVTSGNTFHALNAKNGEQLWQCKLQHYIGGTGICDNNTITIVDNDGYIHIIDLAKRKIKQIIEAENIGKVGSSPQIFGDDIFISSETSFCSVNMNTQKTTLYHKVKKTTKNYFEYSSPAFYEKTIYVGSTDGYLYAYQTKLVHYDFKVNIVSGSLQGNTYQGSFSYNPEKLRGKGKEEIEATTTKFTFLDQVSIKTGNITFENGIFKDLHLQDSTKNHSYGINDGFGRDPKYFRRYSEQFIINGKSFFAYLNPQSMLDGAGTVTYTRK
ncbi:protein kinase domain-containing protein [Candidatus Uabimicrobium amorphum]|uniref:Serine/threonine-protein kinase PrkC n=1 Tax=Uabimicrobium amorphum TaxID=2596890 RepID=A0A5S9INC4_UABAM|nr:serine/threonine-protein kinase [Candidatus Uabimicrobium amorphum]BBM84700.1 serine/threonine-protein kinase PrkC [Candidatus Uabimicrobium amorphum]